MPVSSSPSGVPAREKKPGAEIFRSRCYFVILLEVTLQQAFQTSTMTSLVASHLIGRSLAGGHAASSLRAAARIKAAAAAYFDAFLLDFRTCGYPLWHFWKRH